MKLVSVLICSVALGLGAGIARAQDAKIVRAWKAKCASCHGEDGRGQTTQGAKMGIRDIGRADAQKLSDAQLRDVVVKGLKRTVDGKAQEMDGYPSLAADVLDGLVAYMRTFRRAAAPAAAPASPAPAAPKPAQPASPAPASPASAQPASPAPASPASAQPASPAPASPASAQPASPAPASPASAAPLVDINSASKTELKKRLKLTTTQISKLIKKRPYAAVDELVTKKVLTKTALKKIAKLVEARPVEPAPAEAPAAAPAK